MTKGIIAENERDSPWAPFSVRKGFKKNENIVSLFNGWGIFSAKNWKYNIWGKEMNYPQIIKDIFYLACRRQTSGIRIVPALRKCTGTMVLGASA